MNALELKTISSIFNDYDVFLLDLWGVIGEGDNIYPGVVDTINYLSLYKQVYFVSNAPRPAIASFKSLKSWGIKTEVDNVITSGEVAIQLIISKLQHNKHIIFHLGADRNNEILSGINIGTTTDILKANVLLLSLYRNYGEDLNEFDELLKQAADLKILSLCINPDTIIKHGDNFIYTAGYFAKKLENFGNKVIYIGKPYPEIYNFVFSKLKEVRKERILMIGDTIETDILGASGVGIHSALVLTGNTAKFHNHLETIEEKLNSLSEAIIASKISPNFVISLV